MDTKIQVPNMGESIVEATVSRWLKKVGDPVASGEALLELETNKANLEVAAEKSGTLSKIERNEGEDVRVGETLGIIAVNEKENEHPAPVLPAQEQSSTPIDDKTAEVATAPEFLSEEKITPVAMRLAKEHNLDPNRIPGSGVRGKVLKEDVEKYLAEKEQASSAQAEEHPAPLPREVQVKAPTRAPTERPPETPQTPAAPETAKTVQASPGITGPAIQAPQNAREEHVKLSRRRRTIAEKLVSTQNSAAMLTTFNDVDMSAVMKIRQARKQLVKEKYGVGLGIVSFFVKAAILALKDFPRLNAEIQGDEMVIKHYYDIGIAIGDEEGLVVPIIREADRLSIIEIEKAIHELVQKTKDHALSLVDVMGGTFTITNGGVYGSMLSTPILNGPEVGILGLHRIEDRAVVVNSEVAVRPMMYLALSYDHRIVDGREAVQFLVRIKEAIQDPEVLLLGM